MNCIDNVKYSAKMWNALTLWIVLRSCLTGVSKCVRWARSRRARRACRTRPSRPTRTCSHRVTRCSSLRAISEHIILMVRTEPTHRVHSRSFARPNLRRPYSRQSTCERDCVPTHSSANESVLQSYALSVILDSTLAFGALRRLLPVGVPVRTSGVKRDKRSTAPLFRLSSLRNSPLSVIFWSHFLNLIYFNNSISYFC